jgi:genome maintenance exonuclease 1
MSESIKRVVINGFRYYQVSDSTGIIGTFPSVTSVLGETSDKSGLDAWRNRIGHQKAEQIGKDAANRGTVMHRLCEIYLNLPQSMSAKDRLEDSLSLARLDDEIDQFDNRAKIVGGMLFYNFVKSNSFDEIKRVIAQEKFLWTARDGGFAGTVDNVSELITNDVAIVDFKTARKPKDEKWIEDYKLQVSAYSVAVWDRMQVKAVTCRIWISNEVSISPQHFRMDSSEMREYYYKFRERLADFYKKNPPITIQ